MFFSLHVVSYDSMASKLSTPTTWTRVACSFCSVKLCQNASLRTEVSTGLRDIPIRKFEECIHLIDLREKIPKKNVFHGKIYGFRERFSLSRQPIDVYIFYRLLGLKWSAQPMNFHRGISKAMFAFTSTFELYQERAAEILPNTG